MRTVSVAEAKAHFSALLDAVEAGEEVTITRRGRAIARLNPESQPKPDFTVFRKYRGVLKKGMTFDRDDLYER